MAARQVMSRSGKSAVNTRRSNPELIVLSREEVERYEPRRREICISISDPYAKPARLSSRFVAVIRMYFSDVTQREDPTDILFAPDHARALSKPAPTF